MLSKRWKLAILTIALGVFVLLSVMLVPTLRERALDALPSKFRIRIMSWHHGVDVDHDLRITMPDGVTLAGSLYLPRDAKPPLPTVLVRVPYGRLDYAEGYTAGLFFGRNGYAVLVQDLRGTGQSGGELLPWRDAESDGAATLEWITRQPWSNGKVGTFGCSALGETQFALARRGHPAHAAMIASGAGGAIGSFGQSYGYFGVYEGGVFQLASGFGWFVNHGTLRPDAPPARPFDVADTLRKLPLNELVSQVRPAPNGYAEYLDTPLGDPRWDNWGFLREEDRIAAPLFTVNTWNDQTVGDALLIAERVRSSRASGASHDRVLIAPGDHCTQEDALALDGWYLRWFDRWLRGRGPGLDDEAPYTWFMLGENAWHSSDQWPPAEAQPERWYLSGSRPNTAGGDGRLAQGPDGARGAASYQYDPANPAPTRGGPVCCTADPRTGSGMVDQRDVEARPDVLVFTSSPLEADLKIVGPIRAVLTVSSDAPDTDIVARMVDVDPEGRATNIQEGALRLRWRDGPPARPLEPGLSYQLRVNMRAIAYRLSAGHRLRLDVTSSSFPRLERNLNTGGDYGDVRMRTATNTLHFGEGASYLEVYRLDSSR